MWKLDRVRNAGLPLYKQVILLIENAIENGLLTADERLPSERNLSELLGVNRSTVIRALDELADRGVLLRMAGSGTYVNPEKWGLQSYPILNWQQPPALLRTKKNNAYYSQAEALRREARRGNTKVMDLSKDNLPDDLLPALSIPELSWKDVVSAEQGDEAAHFGLAPFRRTVQNFLRETLGLDVGYEQILITSGTRQAVFLITQCLLRPGDAIGVEAPSYFYSLPVFQAAGLRLYALPMDDEGVTLDGLDVLAQRKPLKMIFLNPVFQNPTGSLMSGRRKQDIVRYCSRKRIPIVEDDAYSLLGFDPGLDISPLKKHDCHNQTIYTGSLSSYAGRNLRVGWMIAPEAITRRLAEIRQQMDAGLSVLPQLLAQQYMAEDLPGHRLQLQKTLAERAELFMCWLKDLYGSRLGFHAPKGGLYLRARLENGDGQEYETLLRSLLQERIIVAQGADFGDGPGTFRVNYGHFNKK